MEGLVQNDQILINGEDIWVIDRNENALYKVDNSSGECELVVLLPALISVKEKTPSYYRVNPCCYQKGEFIFCMPDRGNTIIVYNLKQSELSEIEIENPNNFRLSIHDFWEIDDRLWAVSCGLGQILEVDLDKKIIEHYYDVFDNKKDLLGYEAKREGNTLFFCSRYSNRLCEFDVKMRTKKIYEIPGLQEGVYTICTVENQFWFAGISGKIYVWDKKNIIREMKNYPSEIKVSRDIYTNSKEENLFLKSKSPVFYRSFLIDDTVCFLPLNSEQAECDTLLCVNRKNGYMWSIKLREEGQSRHGIYTLEYICPEGKVGILFSNSSFISEIDIYKNTIKKCFLRKKIEEAQMNRAIEMNQSVHETKKQTLKMYGRVIQRLSGKDKYDKFLEPYYGKRILDIMLKLLERTDNSV